MGFRVVTEVAVGVEEQVSREVIKAERIVSVLCKLLEAIMGFINIKKWGRKKKDQQTTSPEMPRM